MLLIVPDGDEPVASPSPVMSSVPELSMTEFAAMSSADPAVIASVPWFSRSTRLKVVPPETVNVVVGPTVSGPAPARVPLLRSRPAGVARGVLTFAVAPSIRYAPAPVSAVPALRSTVPPVRSRVALEATDTVLATTLSAEPPVQVVVPPLTLNVAPEAATVI